jgi:4-diphosphocytidyl-2-C-methyl-D-erythritol kinase
VTVRIEAPAKLTLSLRVTGVRADGYHLIDAEMVSLQLHDVVTVTPSTTSELHMTGPFAHGISSDEDNLVLQALRRVSRSAHVLLEKNIPHGGGLGGGSTDAAAIFRWATYSDLERAASLGADIPFCMIGGRAHVGGIGELIEPLPHIDQNITLIVPPLHVSTPAVYKMWDHMGGPSSESGNDLEPAALRVEPELAQWKEAIANTCGIEPTLAGSGATWFVVGHHENLYDKKLVLNTRTIRNTATVILTSTRHDAGAITVESSPTA